MSDGAENLPAVTAELVALRVMTEAHFRIMKPRDRLRLQQSLFEILAEMDEEPIRIRPAVEVAALKIARGRAKLWLGQLIQDIVRRTGAI